MQIPFRSPNMRMAHQGLDRLEINSLAQKGSSECMTDHMRMDPFPNQSLFHHEFDKAIDSLGSKAG